MVAGILHKGFPESGEPVQLPACHPSRKTLAVNCSIFVLLSKAAYHNGATANYVELPLDAKDTLGMISLTVVNKQL